MKLILYAPDQILFSDQKLDDISYIGYNEYTVLEYICLALDELDPKGKDFVLVTRPHPADKTCFWNEIKRRNGSSIKRDSKTPIDIAIASADLVIGMYSTFLVLSFLAGKSIISAQIGLNRAQPFSFCRRGTIVCANKYEILFKQMQSYLFDEPSHNTVDSSYMDEDPSPKIVDFIENERREKYGNTI